MVTGRWGRLGPDWAPSSRRPRHPRAHGDARELSARNWKVDVSCYPDHYEGSLAGLLQKADQALYAAKRAGKDRVMLSAA